MPIPAPQNQLNTEKRRHPRRKWLPKLTGVFVSDNGRRVLEQLQGVDISKSGMGIAGSRQHPVGTHLIISLPEYHKPGGYVHAKVVRCWEEKSQIRMGLEFDDSPDDMVLPDESEVRRVA